MDTTLTGLLRGLIGASLAPKWLGAVTRANEGDAVGLCRALLSTRGEVSGIAIADRILSLIEQMDDDAATSFFHVLRDEFEVDRAAVLEASKAIQSGAPEALTDLQRAAEPPRQELFRRLNAAPRGTARLVDMRSRLLKALRHDRTLAPIDTDLRHLLRSWFNRGFLVLRHIDWSSPAALLEKIIAYEAVHAIGDWDALRERLQPRDRRCFAFFHPAMPDEPLIFVEVALTRGVATSIDALLSSPRADVSPESADTAIFYSISNCQKGLSGISFGALLIKQVVADLKADLPNLKTFATLSPVPGLAKALKDNNQTPETQEALQQLPGLTAAYLVRAKDAFGKPLDPVARFHLGNGAVLHRINTDADRSPTGQARSFGMMVNYLYELDRIEARHEAFAANGDVAISQEVRAHLKDAPTQPDKYKAARTA
ncbi:MAG: decarboxylase [Salinarimonadaceae bacterium]|nr:MAG: decarboxylase [Salinarimonadaceae bacterium]